MLRSKILFSSLYDHVKAILNISPYEHGSGANGQFSSECVKELNVPNICICKIF